MSIILQFKKFKNTHSSILAWKNPWTEESGGLKSMGLHDWARVHEGGGRWVGSNKLVEPKKKKSLKIILKFLLPFGFIFLFLFIRSLFPISWFNVLSLSFHSLLFLLLFWKLVFLMIFNSLIFFSYLRNLCNFLGLNYMKLPLL